MSDSHKNLSIKEWSADDQPREKLLNKGISSLSDAELVAILIRSGSSTESAVDLGKIILNSVDNNLNELSKKDVDELTKIKGIGTTKALSIIAALELGKRKKQADFLEKQKIGSSKDVFDYFYAVLSDIPYEEFWVVFLSRSNKIISRKKISQGGISGTVTDVRIILKMAIEQLASGIILCHNHPSGNLEPSKADILITEKIKEAGKLMDINVLDHIIVTNESYYSFADEGIM